MRSKRSVEKKKQDAILRILVLLLCIQNVIGFCAAAIGKDMANKIMI